MTELIFLAASEEDTDRLGAALAGALPDGAVVALCGTLGAGKTRLIQAVAAACGIAREEVVSPTFLLCQQYRGRRTINHFDVYRLRDEEEFWQLGPDEYFASQALTFIEWGDRVIDGLPAERVEVRIAIQGDERREFRVSAAGAGLAFFLQALQALLGSAASDRRDAQSLSQ